MINLIGSGSSLKAIVASGGTVNLGWMTNATDTTTPPGVAIGQYAQQGNQASAATITVMLAPADNVCRNVVLVSFVNASSDDVTVTVVKDNSVSVVPLTAPVVLQQGWALRFQIDVGWQVFDGSGSIVPGVITLTGDVTGSGTSSIPTTLATVNSDVGSFTNANITVNAKGLVTAASSGAPPGETVTTVAFAWSDISTFPLFTVPAGKIVFGVELIIATPFNGTSPALTVGDAGDTDRLMTTVQNNPAAVGTYSSTPSHVYGSPTVVNLYITPGSGASAGSGYAVIRTQA